MTVPGVALSALLTLTAAGAPEAVAPAPVPRFKPSIEELSNFATMPAEAREAMVRALATRLVERLEADPADVEGWLRLAQARLTLGERPLALFAFRRALALAPRSPSVLKAYAAAELGERDPVTGWPMVTAEAFLLYRRLAMIDPREPEARWYLGLHAFQTGDVVVAADQWRALLRLLPPETAAAETIRQRLEGLREAAARPAS